MKTRRQYNFPLSLTIGRLTVILKLTTHEMSSTENAHLRCYIYYVCKTKMRPLNAYFNDDLLIYYL